MSVDEPEDAFLRANDEAVELKSIEESFEILRMLELITARHKHIVEVDENAGRHLRAVSMVR